MVTRYVIEWLVILVESSTWLLKAVLCHHMLRECHGKGSIIGFRRIFLGLLTLFLYLRVFMVSFKVLFELSLELGAVVSFPFVVEVEIRRKVEGCAWLLKDMRDNCVIEVIIQILLLLLLRILEWQLLLLLLSQIVIVVCRLIVHFISWVEP